MKYWPPFDASGADDPYVNGDPDISREGSIPPAESIEHPQREIVHFIEKSDFTPNEGDLYQLTKAARSQFVNWSIDTGSVNTLSVTLDPPLQAYKQGLPLRVLVSQTNTGATTINVNGLGARPVRRSNGAELLGGDIRAAGIADMVDDGTHFQLINFLGAISGVTNNYNIDIPYAEDAGTQNNIVVAFVPAITSPQPGDLILVKLLYQNSGPVTIRINALTAKPVYRIDGQPLQARDHYTMEVVLLEYHTTYWQMMHLVRSQVYMKLEADLTLWVRTDGNDANDGSLNDAAHAFRTIQAAINFVSDSFLIGGRQVTIRLGIPGTYDGGVGIYTLPGTIRLWGDVAANGPARGSYIVRHTPGPSAGDAVMHVHGSGSTVEIKGLTFHNDSIAFHTLYCSNMALVSVYNCRFQGATSNTGVGGFSSDIAIASATLELHDYIDFYRNSYWGIILTQGGTLQVGEWFTMITTNNVTFHGFLYAVTLSAATFSATGAGFSGTAYGIRYSGIMNSVIHVQGAGPNRLPGSIAGSVDASSVYS